MKVKLYVEGGGAGKDLRITCTRGFRELLNRAGFTLRPVACGSSNAAFDRFKTALDGGDDHYPMLLVDSEAPVTKPAWEHLRDRKQDHWKRPKNADDDQAQLMVQCMETWCVADRKALRGFFGQCLQESALPPLNNLEGRASDDIQKKLRHATRECGDDRMYSKGKRSFELLAKLDPSVLKKHLPHFKSFCDVLAKRLNDCQLTTNN
ncbi:MAG: DUF4276 family protein [Phycisphaerae bacterium]|nr:DUF4276 family protein [Phycisphaerae bacterium]